MADQMVRATAQNGYIRAVGVVTTAAVAEARERHHLSHVATAALGRMMSASLLLVSSSKEPQARISVQAQGEGPLGKVWADAGVDGTVRGYVQHPTVEIPLSPAGKLDVGSAVGRYGYIHVIRDYGEGYPYASTVELVSGEIGTDITQYLATSEQTPSAVLLGELLDVQGVRLAGGILLQLMPGYPEDVVDKMEALLSTQSFTGLLGKGHSLETVLMELLRDFDGYILPKTQPVRFHCPCSAKRVLGALRMLGHDELLDMLHTDHGAEATCHFCSQVYAVSEEELAQLVEELQPQSVYD